MTDLRVLGPISVSGSSGDLEIGGPRQRRLLAALVVNANSVVSTPQLIDMLWQGEPPEGAQRSFKSYVGRLRTALAADDAADLIVTYPAGYALEADPDHIDASRFERLVERARAELALGEATAASKLVGEALALWRGSPCDEFVGEEWVEPFAARLEAAHASALELRVEVMLAVGHHGDALPEIDHLVEQFPYRDGLRRLRMLALYRSGRQVDALREYQRYRQMLADEIGIEPGDDLVRLEQQILARDPELLLAQQARRKIGDYELGERVGVDDTAVVYHARQTSIGREVAVKVIRPELANDLDFIRRFEAEAQLLAALEHPNIVPLYDFWREPGSAYLVTRWLGGGSLRDRLATGPFPLDAIVRLTDDLAGALNAVRAAGIANSDLTSNTILFDEVGHAHLTRLGIAAVDVTTTTQDRQGVEPSARADVASIGRVLHEALTGSPSSGPSDTWDAAPLRHDIPATLDAAVRTACAADRADRFSNPLELAAAARAAFGGVHPRGGTGIDRPRQEEDTTRRMNPYKGLRAFGEGDARDFFGREHLVDVLVESVTVSRFVVVVGPSGSGKSSTVRAGLIPRLRALGDRSPTSARPFVTTMVPGSNPFAELERALERLSPRATTTTATSAAGIARGLREVLPPDAELVLVIDQFEELFTSVDTDDRDAFLGAVRELVDDSGNRLRIVITIRADFYDRPLEHPAIGALVRDNSMAVAPLGAEELEAAITGPARRLGVDFEPALVAELVADAARNPNTLPMLQFTLTELFEQRRDHVIRSEDYHAMGGLAGIIAARADALYTDLPADQHDAVRRLFGQLVIPGEGAEDTRRRALVNELPNVPDNVVDAYARARLLSYDRDPVSRVPTVEIAHEALIRSWPRLRGWIDEDRDALRALRHLSTAVSAWDERGRDTDELYRGARLAGALELKADHGELLNDVANEFITTSAHEAESDMRRARRTTRRLRGLLAATAIALVLALIAGAVAVSRSRAAQERTREAELATMLVAANEARESEPQLAALLALELDRRSDDRPAIEALQSVVTADLRKLATWTPESGSVSEIAAAGDGSRIAVATRSSVEVFDVESNARVGPVHEDVRDPRDDGGRRLVMSSDGRVVGASRRAYYEDGRRDEVTLIDVESGHRSPGPHTATVPARGVDSGEVLKTHSAFNPASQMITFSWIVYAAALSAIYSGDDLETPITLDEDEIVLGFSGDGSRMLTSVPRPAALRIRSTENLEVVAEVPSSETGVQPNEFEVAWLDFNGQHLIGTGHLGVVVVNLDSEPPIVRVQPEIGDIDDVATSAGGLLAVAAADGVVRLYDVAGGEAAGVPLYPRPGGNGVRVAFLPDGTLVTGGRELTLWDTTGASVVGPAAEEGDYGALFSPDGQTLVTTDHFGVLYVHDAATGRLRARADIGRNGEYVVGTPMAFAPDGTSVIAVGGLGSDNQSGQGVFRVTTRMVIDMGSAEPIADESTPNETTFDASSVAINPTGDLVVIGRQDGGVELRSYPDLVEVDVAGDITKHQNRFEDSGRDGKQRVASVGFSSTGQSYLALSDQGVLRRWSVATGELQLSEPLGIEMFSVLDGGRLLTSAADGSMVVRDEDGVIIGPEFRGHQRSVTSFDVADGLLATASSDETVRLWDLTTGQPIGQPIHVRSEVVDLSDDGRRLAIVNQGAVSIVSLDPEVWREAACRLAGRNLTQAEWDAYLPPGEPYRATCPQWPAAVA